MTKPRRSAEAGFQVAVREIAHQPGTQRTVTRTFPTPEALGTDVIGVPEGSDVELDVSLESVTDGIWVSGTVRAQAIGECGRCLDEVRLDVAPVVQGLFVYPESSPEQDAEDAEDVYEFDGETVDLAVVSRDAVAAELPFTPLCDPDCPGLCDQCGARLADDPDHEHEMIDPRWSALEGLTETKES